MYYVPISIVWRKLQKSELNCSSIILMTNWFLIIEISLEGMDGKGITKLAQSFKKCYLLKELEIYLTW